MFDELGIAKTIVPFLSIFVFINFQGKPRSIHFELLRKIYPLFLSSPTFQVGEDGSDTDWNMTVRLPEGLPEDFDYSEPVNIVTREQMMMKMIMGMMTIMTMIMMMIVPRLKFEQRGVQTELSLRTCTEVRNSGSLLF